MTRLGNKIGFIIISLAVASAVLSYYLMKDASNNQKIEYWASGSVKKEYNRNKDGFLNGRYTSYYESGKKEVDGLIENGIGELMHFREDGIHDYKLIYRNGEWTTVVPESYLKGKEWPPGPVLWDKLDIPESPEGAYPK